VPETATEDESADEPPVARSSFEPPARSTSGSGSTRVRGTGAGQGSAEQGEAKHADKEQFGDGLAAAKYDPPYDEYAGRATSAYQAVSRESPDTPDFDLAGAEEGALGQLRTLYASAERMGPETVASEGPDRQLDQLLARQRKLISEYFKESNGLDGPGPTGPADATRDTAVGDKLVSFGTGQWGAR
jgi:hypothetical protein